MRPTPPCASSVSVCPSCAPASLSFDLAGISVPLEAAQLSATYNAAPATGLTNGLLMGFLSEATADSILLPATLPLVGGQPLSFVLPGGPGNCSLGDDRDTGPDGSTPGWWFYFNFTAVEVTYSGL